MAFLLADQPTQPLGDYNTDRTHSFGGVATGSSGASETQFAGHIVQRVTPGVGEDVGPVRLIREIGKGGMGTVFLGQHKLLGRSVAVKFLHIAANQKGSTGGWSSFFAEAKAAALVRHPNLTEIFHADISGETPYLVMEHIDGPTLGRLVEHHGRLSQNVALMVLRDIAAAVAQLHEHELIHRDLKPSNVLVDENGRIAVTDFGLAVQRRILGGATEAMDLAGTPTYMAPEMFEGRVSARTDIYALGILAFHLLTGKLPFDGTLLELREKHVNEALPLEQLRSAGVSDELIEIIERATHKQMLFRHKAAQEFLRALQHVKLSAEDAIKAKGELCRLVKLERTGAKVETSAGNDSTTNIAAAPPSSYADTIARAAAQKRQRMQSISGQALPEPAEFAPPGESTPRPFVRETTLPPTRTIENQVLSYHDAPLENPRPGILTAACVISLVIAGLSALVWTVGCIIMAFDKTPYPATVRVFQWSTVPVSLATTVLLAWGAIASLGLRPIGRKLLLIYCWVDLAVQTLSAAAHMIWEVPIALKHERDPAFSPTVNAWVHYGGYAVGWLLMTVFIVCLLIVLHRPRVKAAFDAGPTPSPA